MLVLGLPSVEKYENLWINCISRLLTALSILSTLFNISIYQQFAPKIGFFLNAMRFLHMHFLWFFRRHILRLWHFWQLKCLQHRLLKALKETEALFLLCVRDRDCFRLRESGPALKVESQAEILWVVKELQKQTSHSAKIFYWEKLERRLLTILV